MREPSKAKSVARVSGDNSTPGISASTSGSSGEKEKKGVTVFITDEIYSTLLDVSLKNMLKNSANTTSGLLEVWSEELEGKSDFCNYRTKLVCLLFSCHLQTVIAADPGQCPTFFCCLWLSDWLIYLGQLIQKLLSGSLHTLTC